MKITINDHRKIYAIQEEFNKLFPYLKLEFFSKSNTSQGCSSAKKIKHSSKTIAECRTIHNNGSLELTPAMTVTDLEQRFNDVYGIHTQVLRKSGNVWLETSVTDGWTLEEQNSQGESLDKEIT